MRVDAHHHVWDLAVRDLPWTHGSPVLHRTYTVDDLRPALLRNAIDATVVVQTCAVAEETAELLALAAGDPHMRGSSAGPTSPTRPSPTASPRCVGVPAAGPWWGCGTR